MAVKPLIAGSGMQRLMRCENGSRMAKHDRPPRKRSRRLAVTIGRPSQKHQHGASGHAQHGERYGHERQVIPRDDGEQPRVQNLEHQRRERRAEKTAGKIAGMWNHQPQYEASGPGTTSGTGASNSGSENEAVATHLECSRSLRDRRDGVEKENMSMTTAGADGRGIISTREFAVPRELLFQAFSDPTQLAQWWGQEGLHEHVRRI